MRFPMKILCPTDFSRGSQQAMRTAVRITTEKDAELVIAHVWFVRPVTYAGDYAFPGTALGQMAEDARRGLDDAVQAARAAGARRVSGQMLTGVPWSKLVEEIEAQAFDLCVMGTQGLTGLARIMLGSVAEKVVRHAPCSVLVVRPDTEPKPFMHVLVPTDFSDTATSALDLAAALAPPEGARITMLHVIEFPTGYPVVATIPDFARDLELHSAEALDRAAARITERVTVPVVTKSRIGYPGAQIFAELEHDPSVDLVVTGSHGRTGIKRALLGSVAEKVVRHARCPVLVARGVQR
jgi:nucleotide-binding universal stress UspA family protein